ncbi:serine/threonine-protein kinase [Streptomyces sp. 142MFCol3.1]|uniref:serine/threonine-protein kinase n=1 Tax=Streptomyces sp. 142MFCol3.1 TaxID=1172179 RepID=UPI00048ABB53|nr:serine/threonine-protein kinase [Streptomyces sp. 142MFCol3.1]
MPPRRSTGTDAEAEHPRYAGQYLLEAELGSGGMGIVHLARSASGLRLAVKVVHAEFAQDPEFRGRFRQEVAAARRVSGAFTAPVVDADPEAGLPWMATLFIPGPTLAEHVKRNGALPPARLRHLMAGLAEALRDIHRAGVVHRDLKPSNVLLAGDGPKVIDFGISRPSDSELRTETGKLIGTPPFMAPEQFRRPRQVGPAADVFALGSVIVHAATGSGPFDSDSPYLVAYQVVHDEPDLTGVPEDIAGLVSRCLAKEPEDRPTPDELMTALRSVSASYDTQAFIPEQRTRNGESARHGQEGRADAPSPSAASPWTDPAADDEGPASESGPVSGTRSGPVSGAGNGPVSGAWSGPAADDETHARGSGPAHPEAPAPESRPAQPGASRASGASGTSGTETGPAAPRSARRRLPLAVAAAGLAVVVAVGATVLLAGSDHPAPQKKDTRQRSASAFRPWEVGLTARGAEATGQPHCTYTPHTLYCIRPGVLAAAVDATDGRVLWSRDDTARRGTDVAQEPVLSGGLLHVLSRGGKQLTALDPATGRTRWSRDVTRYEGRVAHAGGVVLLTGPDSRVTALDAATGKEKWRHALPGQTMPSFSSYGDGVAYAVTAAGTETRVAAVDPQTGAMSWQRHLAGTLSIVGAHDGAVWFTSTATDSYTDAVVRYDVARRAAERVALRFPLPGAQAAVAGDTVYLLADGGALVAVDTRTSKQLWRAETSVSWASAPVVAGHRLYLSAVDGRLLAVDTARGTLLGQTKARLGDRRGSLVNVLPAPVAAPGRVYGTAPDGSLFAVDARDPSAW